MRSDRMSVESARCLNSPMAALKVQASAAEARLGGGPSVPFSSWKKRRLGLKGSWKEHDKRWEGWWVASSAGLGFAYAEHGCSAVGADAFDGRLAVLERDVLGVLDFHACFAFDAVCLWHIVHI